MAKFFVHEINHLGEGKLDKDKEYYRELHTRIYIYTDDANIDLSSIIYWSALESIGGSIKDRERTKEYKGYISGFDKISNVREIANYDFAEYICEKLNGSIQNPLNIKTDRYNWDSRKHITPYDNHVRYGGHYKGIVFNRDYQSYEIKPSSSSKTAYSPYLEVHHYDPKQTDCRYEISSIFRDAPSLEERFNSFANTDPEFIDISKKKNDLLKKINELKQEISKLNKEKDTQISYAATSRIRIRQYCEFVRQYILQRTTHPNEEIKGFDISILNCNFISDFETSMGIVKNGFTKSSNFPYATLYPLNIAYELDDKDLFSKLVENGAYKFSYGFFYSLGGSEYKASCWDSIYLNPCYSPKIHCLENFLSYVDDKHYKLLYNSLKETTLWCKELDSYFSPEKPKVNIFITLHHCDVNTEH